MNHEKTKSGNWNKNAKWLRVPGPVLKHDSDSVQPAPFFRKTLSLDKKPSVAEILICGLGYYELYINGRKVGDHVLDPVVTHYDKRVSYVTYEIIDYLLQGTNVIGVILGNGWYNCHTHDVWHFEEAIWRDFPKFLLQMSINGKNFLNSDTDWKVTTGPIVFDGLRNGETYDAKLELNGWQDADYDVSSWMNAIIAPSPGGTIEKQTMPPCKVMDTIPSTNDWGIANRRVYDIGQNITGWARITVEGETGAELKIRYGERLDSEGKVDQEHIGKFIYSGKCQTDHYILNGKGLEQWEPRFTYHGFQYVQIEINGNAAIKKVEGRVVHTSFDKIGSFECSNKIINKLQQCTLWSYLGNFTGIPTDCPHREKNGWTGDAHLAAETGLFNYDASSSYAQWIDSVVDAQRPSGQLPVIVPTSNWGYNRNGGPAWDSALLLIPWYVYLYTGDDSLIRKHYDAIKRYVDYCSTMADGFIVDFSLGDWAHVEKKRIVATSLTSTAYYYTNVVLLAKFAKMTDHKKDRKDYTELAAEIKKALNQRFYKGEGIYAKGEQTAMACALYHELVDDTEKASVVNALASAVKDNDCKPDFGILGAKYVPRVLADNGYPDLAYKIITQPEFPGWVNWLNQDATTLWESWSGESSLNHIMFGDISAWFYQYLGGIKPDPDHPGFAHFFIRPHRAEGLDWVKAEHRCPNGKIISSWRYENKAFMLDVEIPQGCSATVILPRGQTHDIDAGKHLFVDN